MILEALKSHPLIAFPRPGVSLIFAFVPKVINYFTMGRWLKVFVKVFFIDFKKPGEFIFAEHFNLQKDMQSYLVFILLSLLHLSQNVGIKQLASLSRTYHLGKICFKKLSEM